MPSRDLTKFRTKRLSPFKGLVIDVPTWADAHNYHCDQQRLHSMSSHQHGVVTGLEVVAWNPPDNSLVIYPGVALDPDGNTIVVQQPQRFYIRVEEKGLARVGIRYSEIEPDVSARTASAKQQPLYVTEAFRIEEQRQRPTEAYIELARIDVGEGNRPITNAADPYHPQKNEIDTRFRSVSDTKPGGQINIAILSYPLGKSTDDPGSHFQGVMNLARFIEQSTGYAARLVDKVELDREILDCELLCMTGHREFELSAEEMTILRNYFNRGGVLFAESCPGPNGEYQDQVKGFRSSFASMCNQLEQTLRSLEMTHPLFQSYHVFGTPPAGHDGPAVVIGSDSIVYTDADYGCVWNGGKQGHPLSRQIIRDSLEFGANIAIYSSVKSRLEAIKIVAT